MRGRTGDGKYNSVEREGREEAAKQCRWIVMMAFPYWSRYWPALCHTRKIQARQRLSCLTQTDNWIVPQLVCSQIWTYRKSLHSENSTGGVVPPVARQILRKTADCFQTCHSRVEDVYSPLRAFEDDGDGEKGHCCLDHSLLLISPATQDLQCGKIAAAYPL